MKCDNCKKTAKYNIEKVWVEYTINKHDEYSQRSRHVENQDPSEENNLHLCKQCRDEWLKDFE